MIDGLLDLPAHLRSRLQAALRSGALAAPFSAPALQATLGGAAPAQIEAAVAALNALASSGISCQGTALWLQTIGKVEARRPRTDLVWSGPEVLGLHARDTRRVYEELLGSAERSVWASSYVFFDGPKAFQVLAQRMDARPDLEVTLLLNIQRKKGDTTAADSLVFKFAEHFWKFDWPGSRKPRVFYDPRALDLNGPGGVLHAKAVVTDDQTLFVTSANLTEAALEKNIEVGILQRDPPLARSLIKHFLGLIEGSWLLMLPSV